MIVRYIIISILFFLICSIANSTSKTKDLGYTLQECIQTALEQNPDIRMADQNVAVADAQKDFTRGERWPAITLESTYTHSMDPQRVRMIRRPNEPSTFSKNIWEGDISLSLPLFTGGRIIHSIKAAELLHLSSKKRLARTRKELVFNISSVFYDILGQKNVVDSLQFSQKVLEEHEQRIKQLIQAERAAKVDLLRTKVQLANVIQNQISEANKLDILKQTLANLMGIENANKSLEIEGELKEKPLSEDQYSILDQAYENRSDFQADKAEYQAQTNRIEVSAAERWPSIFLFGSYGGNGGIDPDYKQLGAATLDDTGMIGISVEFPIFVGGRIEAKVREEKAKQELYREKVRKRRLQIKLEVDSAIKTIRSNYQRVLATKTAIDQAKESIRIEQEKYHVGKGTIIDVLDAQSALLESESNYYRALSDLNIAHAQLKLAMGERY